MTEEQRKWYLAGANDMEAGRLVTKNSAVDFALAQVRDRDLVIESLREQLAEAQSQYRGLMRDRQNAVARLNAAEAKLAEVTEQLRIERERK